VTTHACAGVDELGIWPQAKQSVYDSNKWETGTSNTGYDFDTLPTADANTLTTATHNNPLYNVRGRKIAPISRAHVCLPLLGLLSLAGMAKYLPLED